MSAARVPASRGATTAAYSQTSQQLGYVIRTGKIAEKKNKKKVCRILKQRMKLSLPHIGIYLSIIDIDINLITSYRD